MTDLALSVHNISKQYSLNRVAGERESTLIETTLKRLRNPFVRTTREHFWALKDVCFEVMRGEVVGVIGRNGAGKSTLLKILSRITEPTDGEIRLFGRIGSLLEVGTGFHPELTGRENVFLNGAILGMSRAEIKKEFDAIVDFAGVEKFLDTPVKRYSSGMYVRLAFAVAAHLRSEILIVDEVLAVGDAEFQKRCLGKMQDIASIGRTVMFVSHNMAAVSRLCTRALYLQGGVITSCGSVSEAIANYSSQCVSVGERKFDSGSVRRLAARERNGCLELEAEYALDTVERSIALGFVVKDSQGTVVFGSNPGLGGMALNQTRVNRGRVIAQVNAPRLRSGLYSISFWLGNGTSDFFECVDALNVRITTPSPGDERTHQLGPVVPEVSWKSFPEVIDERTS